MDASNGSLETNTSLETNASRICVPLAGYPNYTNCSTNLPTPSGFISDLILQIFYMVIISFIMLAMGSTVKLADLRDHLRRPVALVVGLTTQILLLPLVTFGMAVAFQMEPSLAIGLLVLGTAPGGSMSNVYTYWVDGDITLSICMTSISTIAAMGTMPLNLYLYGRRWQNSKTKIPFFDILVSLSVLLLPIFIGILVRWKRPRVALIITRLGSLMGILIVGTAIVVQTISDPMLLARSPHEVWAVALCYPLVGFGLGFLTSVLACQTLDKCKAVAFETGCQNVALALAIVPTFKHAQRDLVTLIPTLYAICMLIYGGIFVTLYLCWRKCHPIKRREEADEETTEAGESSGSEESVRSVSVTPSTPGYCRVLTRCKVWCCALDYRPEEDRSGAAGDKNGGKRTGTDDAERPLTEHRPGREGRDCTASEKQVAPLLLLWRYCRARIKSRARSDTPGGGVEEEGRLTELQPL